MRLYAIPFSCTLASHLALREAGVAPEITWLERGQDFSQVSAKNKVPVLEYDDGTRLTENVAVLLAIADQHPAANLGPPPGSALRPRLHEWLSFVATELHKQVLAISFDREAPEASKGYAMRQVPGLLAHVDRALAGRSFLVGDTFSIADAYLFWTTILLRRRGIELARFPELERFSHTVAERPAAVETLKAETAAWTRTR
jgi:glutathione S-transferase